MKVMGKGSLSSFIAALIDIGWYGALVLLMLAMCLLLIAPWVNPPRVHVGFAAPAAFSLEPDTHHVTASPSRVEQVRLEGARASLMFSPRSSAMVAGGAVFLIAALGLVLWVLGQLRAVFRTLRDGRPFVADNATRLRRIGYAVILSEVVQSGADVLRHALRHDSLLHPGSAPRSPANRQHRRDRVRVDHSGDCRGVQGRRAARRRAVADGLTSEMAIRVKLDHLLLDHQLTLTELAERIGITIANLSILKTNKARAIRFSTLEALCRELECQPGDLLEWKPDHEA